MITLININTVTKKYFEDMTLEEDYMIEFECESCGYSGSADYLDDVDDPICPDCGSDEVIPETSHESTACDICGETIDMWEEVATHNMPNSNYNEICTHCYGELESKFG